MRKFHAALFGQVGVAPLQAALHRDRSAHCLHRAGEIADHAVARGTENAPVVLGDNLPDRRAISRQGDAGCLLIHGHEPAVAGDIGCKNDGKLTLHDFCDAPGR